MNDDWRAFAACRARGVDPALFHPEPGPGLKETTEAAKHVCFGCPVSWACLQDAIDSGDEWGIRGGMTRAERRRFANDYGLRVRT